jgi:hypothetical protein
MQHRIRGARALLGAALLGAIVVAGCTPEQIAAVQAAQASDKFRHVVSDSGLARLRQCESGGNYGIVSASGAYRGAYQFHRTTWNSVASRHYPHLVGVDPARAAPFDQDRMARALWAEQGRRPWPHCGKRV